ncbi:5-oxoprolinase/urea amidolyase family protein [Microbacterium jejuense]|uniref:5-oxoprolinase/urea amidolyase family protein n=1 Tax=Microbacterium jejuense TaxID=1263637 RepID=A0ABS7HSX0_9MICO|nr:5-oxoprolinase/urea amidolyase family protein [Microbacterium jejuense]MBW9095336.1 5-oxoprolinase/urea amidolyase family protein [Microbacterium jejuense]
MVTARALPMGDRAFLIEVDGLDEVLAVHAALAASRPGGVTDLVPAARTVLVRVDPRVLPPAIATTWALRTAAAARTGATADGPLVELDIAYDGADLHDTAALLGISTDELVRRHAAAAWRVAFTGFAPGFGYLVSDDWPYDVPRLESPRTRVPAGSVGLAGAFSGAYPRDTPGGWRLIGTTSAPLFDAAAASPALLAPGARVRFRPSTAGHTAPLPSPRSGDLADAGRSAPDRPVSARSGDSGETGRAEDDGRAVDAATRPRTAALRIVEPGLLATVQDLGRPAAASIGVAVSGALDRTALRTANRLLGNPEGAAGIEVTMGGLRAVAETDMWVAVTGAWGPVRLDGHDIDPYEAHAWPAGAELHVDWFAHGARAYVAVRGGIEAPAALGSRATDVLAGLGPPALRAGDLVRVGPSPSTPIPVAPPQSWGAPHDDELELDVAPGPRAEWFAAGTALFDAVWTVTGDADRVGVRLDGPALVRTRAGELPSEGMVPGALQVPPSGRPTILLADGPVTGGYPVIAVVTDASLDLVAQARPGTRIRFRHA